jgi:hypothetical protein
MKNANSIPGIVDFHQITEIISKIYRKIISMPQYLRFFADWFIKGMIKPMALPTRRHCAADFVYRIMQMPPITENPEICKMIQYRERRPIRYRGPAQQRNIWSTRENNIIRSKK